MIEVLAILLLCIHIAHSVSVIYVNGNATVAGNGTIQFPCQSVQCGLSNAGDGDIVQISPGTYSGYANSDLCNSSNVCPETFILTGVGDPGGVIFLGEVMNRRAISITNHSYVRMENITFQNFVYSEKIEASKVDLIHGIPNGGGAIDVFNSNLDMFNIKFLSNKAAIGGAIRITENSNVTMDKLVFEKNTAAIMGGAVLGESSSLKLRDCKFLENSVTGSLDGESDGSGGGIYAFGSFHNQFKIARSEFVNNTAGQSGGAVYLRSISTNPAVFEGNDVIFSGNSLVGHGNCVSITACDASGGALYLDVSSVNLTNCNFTHNSVVTGAANSFSQAGAMYVTAKVTTSNMGVIIKNSYFNSNSAGSYGGAVYVLNQRVHISESHFSGNIAGLATSLFADSATAGGAIWYSSQISNSTIEYSSFTGNVVFGGWGGALFCTNALPQLEVTKSSFTNNQVLSSYTFIGQGGAMMVSHGSNVIIAFSAFLNNTASPRLSVTPLTFSGSGGALFIESAEIFINDCGFSFNRVLTGQFDDGSSGGALLLENVNKAVIKNSFFEVNSAQGYFGYSSYASSGAGGAITLKFSTAQVLGCNFFANWVSVGGTHMSIGGAMAVFFDYTGVKPTVAEPVIIANTTFRENVAYSQLCHSLSMKTGQGGALSVIGTGGNGVQMSHVNFTRNAAIATRSGTFPSLGGAVAVSMISNVTGSDCVFRDNVALYGYGNDIASVSGENADAKIANDVIVRDSKFISLVASKYSHFKNLTANITQTLCMASRKFKQNFPYRRLSAEYSLTDSPPDSVEANNDALLNEWRASYSYSPTTSVDTIEAELRDIEKTRHDPLEGSILDATQLTPRTRKSVLASHIAELRNHKQYLLDQQKDMSDILEEHIEMELQSKEILAFNEEEAEEVEEEASSELTPLQQDYLGFRRQLRQRGRYVKNSFAESPSVIVTTGNALFQNPQFKGDYHIFVGNFLYLREFYSTASSSTSKTSKGLLELLLNTDVMPTVFRIEGEVQQETLILTIIKSELTLTRNDTEAMTMKELRMWNGTMFITNNVTVTGNSSVIDSSIVGNATVFDTTKRNIITKFLPSIRFVGALRTGVGVEVSQSYIDKFKETHTKKSPFFHDDVVDTVRDYVEKIPLLVLDNCVAVIESYGAFTGTWVDTTSQSVEIIVRLRNQAQIRVSENAMLEINTGTLIEADSTSSVAVVNDGVIYLNPVTTKLVKKMQSDASQASVQSSTYSSLHTVGLLQQSVLGSIVLTVDNINVALPIINITTNATLSGKIKIHLHNKTDLNLPLYGGHFSTNWSIAYFQSVDRSPSVPPLISTVDGIDLYSTFSYVNDDRQGPVVETMVVESISCGDIYEYYNGADVPGLPNTFCSICTRNSSCSFCQSGSGATSCVDKGQCAGVVWSSCCGTGDCGPHSSCNTEESFTCEYNCGLMFEDKQGCKLLSITGNVIIFVVAFVVSFGIVALLYYRFYSGQKSEILEELRQNLLSPAALNMSGNAKKSAVPQQFIEDLQQSLILKDVFVNYDELKIEEKIGEGSFGVVFKAFFRGAQVAVKQMRSPLFAELTQNDIEEFRKEAYMMSRLRHPNIVLVMGISLVDVEPVSKRSITVDGENDNGDHQGLGLSSFGRRKTEVKSNKTVCIITEFLDQGSLSDILYGPTRLPPEVFTYELVLACALQAARGMLYLHSHSPPICHRDLKSSNLVVDDHWVVKVTDFGMSRIVPEKVQDLELGIGTAAEEEREIEYKKKYSVDMSGDPTFVPNPSGNNNSNNNNNSGSMFSFSPRSLSTGKRTDSIGGKIGAGGSGERSGSINKAAEGHFSGKTTNSQEDANTTTRYSLYHPEMTSNLGTTAWCAPELLTATNKTRYSVKVDVYSFGMVMWELWEKKRPFDEFHSRFDIMDAIRSGKRPVISDNCPPAYRSIMQRCWQAEPARRPTFKYIERYLKDELARVKRQRTNSASVVGRFSMDNATSALSAIINEFPGLTSRPSQHEFDRPSNVSAHNSGGEVPNPLVNPLMSQAPEGRAPLVAFDRSFSYLTSSRTPDEHSVFEANHYQNSPPGGHGDYFDMASNQPSPEGTATGGAAASSSDSARGQQKPTSGPPNQWRDRYVLKFSGWQASKPDTGLPPSMNTAAGGKGSAHTDVLNLPPRKLKANNVNNSEFNSHYGQHNMDRIDERESRGSSGSITDTNTDDGRSDRNHSNPASLPVNVVEGIRPSEFVSSSGTGGGGGGGGAISHSNSRELPVTARTGGARNSYLLDNAGMFDLDSGHHPSTIISSKQSSKNNSPGNSNKSEGSNSAPVSGTGGSSLTILPKK